MVANGEHSLGKLGYKRAFGGGQWKGWRADSFSQTRFGFEHFYRCLLLRTERKRVYSLLFTQRRCWAAVRAEQADEPTVSRGWRALISWFACSPRRCALVAAWYHVNFRISHINAHKVIHAPPRGGEDRIYPLKEFTRTRAQAPPLT